MQTKFGSFVESWANIFVGFTINYAANWIILPAFGFSTLTAEKNFELGLLYTLISLARSFAIRRWFNGLKFGNVGASQHPAKNGHENAKSGYLPTSATARAEFPMYDGLFAYFPAALAAVARVSKIGNDQHNPGEPLGWARAKSTDHKNKIIRHLLDGDGEDIDGTLHADKLAWRALANAQTLHESRGAPLAPASR